MSASWSDGMVGLDEDLGQGPCESGSSPSTYLEAQGVAALLDEAVGKLVQERPADARMWLAAHFAGDPGCDTLLSRLAALERQVLHLEQLNESLTNGSADESLNNVGDNRQEALPGVRSSAQDSQGWATPASAKVFDEYVGMLEIKGDSPIVERGKVHIDRKCALVVLNMQNDFIPMTRRNPEGGRFAVPESEMAEVNIVKLIEQFRDRGAKIVCCKDYHPYNHTSFIGYSKEGKFPPHCVQGSPGADFTPGITKALKQVLQTDSGREQTCIAFKGFHPDYEAFGAFQQVGAGMEWTGAFALHASNQGLWDDNPSPNAPPDVLALQELKQATRVSDKLKAWGVQQVFVCGVSLDKGVLDTALGAAAHGMRSYIVLDASRPSHVPKFGKYGSGFLTNPRDLKQHLQGSKHAKELTPRLLPSFSLLDDAGCADLSHRLEQVVLSLQQPSSDFPDSLGPWALKPARAIRGGIKITKQPTMEQDGAGEYSLEGATALKKLKEYGIELRGHLSPVSTITLMQVERRRMQIPQEADSYCWAYPLSKAEMLTRENLGLLQSLHSPNFSFPLFGGFLYFKNLRVVGANAISLGQQNSLTFGGCRTKWPVGLKDKLVKAGRFEKITFPAMQNLGAWWFVWIRPQDAPECEHGGFGYLMHEDKEADDGEEEKKKDRWFALKDPNLSES